MNEKDICKLADKLIKKHLGDNWNFKICPSLTEAYARAYNGEGICICDSEKCYEGPRTIILSGISASFDSKTIKYLLLHEIAHGIHDLDQVAYPMNPYNNIVHYHGDDFYDILQSIGGLSEEQECEFQDAHDHLLD